jgi:predicted nucleotidyltransferase
VVEFQSLLSVLSREGVEFIIIGGVAATIHGSSRLTQDLDLVYSRSAENLAKIAKALTPYSPYLRGAPAGLPFRFDVETLRAGLNFTLVTSLGPLDLFGEVAGGGTYESLRDRTLMVTLFGVDCLCLDLEALIATKRAAGRPRDFETIAELEEQRSSGA